jgi:hypothetical protein
VLLLLLMLLLLLLLLSLLLLLLLLLPPMLLPFAVGILLIAAVAAAIITAVRICCGPTQRPAAATFLVLDEPLLQLLLWQWLRLLQSPVVVLPRQAVALRTKSCWC